MFLLGILPQLRKYANSVQKIALYFGQYMHVLALRLCHNGGSKLTLTWILYFIREGSCLDIMQQLWKSSNVFLVLLLLLLFSCLLLMLIFLSSLA